MHQVTIAEAIDQLREQLRQAVLEGADKDIVFTPEKVDIELGVDFKMEAKAGGGFKLMALLSLSAEGKISRGNQHKIKLALKVTDSEGKPLKVLSSTVPRGLEDEPKS